MECWVDFQEGLTSDKRKYPIQQFKAFWTATKRYAELTRSDPLIHTSLAGAANGPADFLEGSVSAFPNTFFGMPSAWSASCLADTTHISRGMNPQDCKCGPITQRPYHMVLPMTPALRLHAQRDSRRDQP